MLSEMNQPQKGIYFMTPFYEVHRLSIYTEKEVQQWFSRAGESGKGELLFNECRISVWEVFSLEMDSIGKCTVMCYVYFTAIKKIPTEKK